MQPILASTEACLQFIGQLLEAAKKQSKRRNRGAVADLRRAGNAGIMQGKQD